jgi:hypothetical protein
MKINSLKFLADENVSPKVVPNLQVMMAKIKRNRER